MISDADRLARAAKITRAWDTSGHVGRSLLLAALDADDDGDARLEGRDVMQRLAAGELTAETAADRVIHLLNVLADSTYWLTAPDPVEFRRILIEHLRVRFDLFLDIIDP